MKPSVYYNEIDAYCAQWLRNLMAAGHIPEGYADTRSIEDVRPDELHGYTQCHFFAGLGGWAYALELAGWGDRPVWTGSCPCQPFSAAGKGAGFADERHLWPAWQHLIAQCRPAVVFGEQVASKDAEPWIDLVHADLEGMGYAFGCVPFPSAGVGAPHIRDRNYWVADTMCWGREVAHQHDGGGTSTDSVRETSQLGVCRAPRGLANTDGRNASAERQQRGGEQRQQPQDGGVSRMADAERERIRACRQGCTDGTPNQMQGIHGERQRIRLDTIPSYDDLRARTSPTNGLWRAADWLACTDGKWRPVEPIAQQMVDGISRGMGLLRSDHVAKEEMIHATEAVGLADQVLRALRNGNAAQAVWGSLGGRIGLPEATFLLAGLCEQSRELGQFFHVAAAGSASGGEASLRAMQQGAPEAARPSPGRGCAEQLAWELGDALPELSQACPSARRHLDQLRQFTGSPLANGVPNRMGRLRAYGNAIVAPQAAEFVATYMQARGLITDQQAVAA